MRSYKTMLDPATVTLIVSAISALMSAAALLHQMKIHGNLCFGACQIDADFENNPPPSKPTEKTPIV